MGNAGAAPDMADVPLDLQREASEMLEIWSADQVGEALWDNCSVVQETELMRFFIGKPAVEEVIEFLLRRAGADEIAQALLDQIKQYGDESNRKKLAAWIAEQVTEALG